ncbi:hypothetical protein V1264_004713 [Littorina saxatilis]|uniref:Uncharacterized protein n=1 Tax=Littorina saxatilis TaxID=31220 RepID=A0AAN9B310_9CAEN
MSEAEVGSQEGGGAPLPPKRPTIIRPTQDGSRPVPTRPAPVRPAPAAPGGRPPPAVPRPPAAASGAPSPVLSKGLSGSAPSPAPTRKPDPPAKDNGKPKSRGSVRKRPEITIVEARPMNQAGFRDMTALDNTAVPKPVHKTSAVTDTSSKPSSNGSVPDIPNRPPPASTSAPSQPRPPAPPSRPGAPHHAPPPVPGKSALPDKPDANHSDAPPKPSRPTILRPGRPKSAVSTGETAPVQNQTSPPPPLPKRSPLMTETAVVGDLMGFDAPPKPERSPRLNNDSQGDEKIGAEDVENGEGHVVPKKPTRVSIIRPPSRPKPVAEDGQRTAERTGEYN